MSEYADYLMVRFNISSTLAKYSESFLNECKEVLNKIDRIREINATKVLQAFHNNNISEIHLKGTTGYGYDDLGRDTLDKIYAEVFGGEAGLVRWQIMSGTHAITTALFGILRPGDELIIATGKPYDTLDQVLGTIRSSPGSLTDWGIKIKTVSLNNGEPDFSAIQNVISLRTKMALIQRSRGYTWRPSLSVNKIKKIIEFLKKEKSDIICFVDNCYGEFAEINEPPFEGADLIAGSLIKNPGAGIAPTGGYLVGNKNLIKLAGGRLSAPGIDTKIGATLDANRLLYQGLFLAPHVVGEAMKTAVFAAYVGTKLGFEVSPQVEEERADIIQAIKFGSREKLIAFCQGIQKGSPIDSHVYPLPSQMPGYTDEVIMAAGTFILGSSIELSCDGAVVAPFAAYLQGGLTFDYGKIGVLMGFQELLNQGLL
jgi:cystathionine beta-lyase family protein involved in aluminum resistance